VQHGDPAILAAQAQLTTVLGVTAPNFAASLDGRLPWTVVEARPGDEPAAGCLSQLGFRSLDCGRV
jgi:hypothetical protein